jgi:hypothetical protein
MPLQPEPLGQVNEVQIFFKSCAFSHFFTHHGVKCLTRLLDPVTNELRGRRRATSWLAGTCLLTLGQRLPVFFKWMPLGNSYEYCPGQILIFSCLLLARCCCTTYCT